MADLDPDFEPCGGLLGRWENLRQRTSCKRIVECDAATPEYQRTDYLKPQHLPAEVVDVEANYLPTSNLQETRFHRGFQRKHKSDIQPDAPRLEYEVARQQARDLRASDQQMLARELKEKVTFNILTGEGVGREAEFRQVGKKILNPQGSMSAIFAEHSRDATNRIKSSKHRFFEHPEPRHSDHRVTTLFDEGFIESKRQSVVIGYGNSNPRSKTQSTGVSDNYAHLRALPAEPQWEAPIYGNRSQVILG